METLLVECIKEKGTNISENGWTSVIKGGIEVKVGDQISVEGIAINARGVSSNSIEIPSDELPGGFAPNKFAFRCSYYINDNTKYTCHTPTEGGSFQVFDKTKETGGYVTSQEVFASKPWNLERNPAGVWDATKGERPDVNAKSLYGFNNHYNNQTKCQPLYLMNVPGGEYITVPDEDGVTSYTLKTDDIPFSVSIGYDTPANIADTLNEQFHNSSVNLPPDLTDFDAMGSIDKATLFEKDIREANFILRPSNGVVNNVNCSMNSSEFWTGGSGLTPDPTVGKSCYNHNIVVSQPEKFDATARLCKAGLMTSRSDIPAKDATVTPPAWELPLNSIYRLCEMPAKNSQNTGDTPFDMPNNLLVPLNLLFNEYNVKNLAKLLDSQKWYQGNENKSTMEEYITDTDRWVSGIAMQRRLECASSGFPADDIQVDGVYAPLPWVVQNGGTTTADAGGTNPVRPPIKSYFPAWTYFSEEWYNTTVFPDSLTTLINNLNQQETDPIIDVASIDRSPANKELIKKYNAGIQCLDVLFIGGISKKVCCLVVKGSDSIDTVEPYDDRAFYRIDADVRPIGSFEPARTEDGEDDNKSGSHIANAGNLGAFAPMCMDITGYDCSKAIIISPFLVKQPPNDMTDIDTDQISYINTEVDLSIGAPNPTILFNQDTNRFEISNLHWSATAGAPNMTATGDAPGADGSLPAVFLNRPPSSGTGDAEIRTSFFCPWGDGVTQGADASVAPVQNNPVYYAESGISIEDILLYNNGSGQFEAITENQYKGCLLDKMGFAYSDIITDKRLNGAWAPRCNFALDKKAGDLLKDGDPKLTFPINQMNLIQSLPLGRTTNFEMDSTTSFGLDAVTSGNNSYGLGGPKSNACSFASVSTVISATSIPTQLANPFWLIYSDIINGITFIGPEGNTANIVATIGREYLSGDYSYAFDAGYTFTATANFTLTQIRTAILDPEFKKTDIGSNSIVIYKIQRPIAALQLAAAFQEPKYKK